MLPDHRPEDEGEVADDDGTWIRLDWDVSQGRQG